VSEHRACRNCGEPVPVRISVDVPRWCPSREALAKAHVALRSIARLADLSLRSEFAIAMLGHAQAAADALGMGALLRADFDLDDDPEARDEEVERAEKEAQ